MSHLNLYLQVLTAILGFIYNGILTYEAWENRQRLVGCVLSLALFGFLIYQRVIAII